MKIQKIARIGLWTAFAVYGFALIFILFLSRIGRYPYESFLEYVKYSVNLIPFKPVWGYVQDYMEQGSWILTLAIRNIGGNFILFFPMGIFLPCLFPKTQKFRRTVLISFCTILCVELIQLLLRCGIFDVDDLILNISGWFLGFAVLKIPFVDKILKKICVLSCEEKEN
ncbi:MAG: VanZ family protein [Ruminococcaceae bacterium]|nr:VanZ family protein [Oscillospiraceae bacterium]